MNWTLHVRLLQSPEASIKSHGSRSQPPSSSQLLKRQKSRNSLHSRRPFHHLLLQIGGARSGGLKPVGAGCVRFPSQLRRRTPERADTRTYAITAVKTYAIGSP
jgi:hypothetical protein